MRRLGLAAIAASFFMATPASAAITLADPNCDLSTGCLFTDANVLNLQPSSIQALEDAFNTAHTGPGIDMIDLTGLFQSGQLSGMSGTFTADQMFDFLIVKAGTNAVLWYTGSVSEFDWSLTGFTQNEASHIVIYGGNFQTSVPEPATWAMMLMGFGAAGYSMRRRRKLITQLA